VIGKDKERYGLCRGRKQETNRGDRLDTKTNHAHELQWEGRDIGVGWGTRAGGDERRPEGF